MWIFGYGSLIWRPGFCYRQYQDGHIQGFVRRFWQGSPDHRGTPTAPGRVATLLREQGGSCFGRAYELAPDQSRTILAKLDHREKAGYERTEVTVITGKERLNALVYWAGPDNPSYLGPASMDEMAQHILASQGPSGPNIDYLLQLDEALQRAGVTDEHVAQLAKTARKLRSPRP